MNLFLPFFFGFSTSFLGMIFPSMLNLTSAKISIERGEINALKYAIGVSVIVVVQTYLAVFIAKYLLKNPDFTNFIQILAIMIFIGLSFYFYHESKKEINNSSTFEKKCRNTFFIGILLSTLNMFAIPFYYGIITILKNGDWMKFNQSNILYFIIGSAIGTFAILYVYSVFAKSVKPKTKKKTNSFSIILSILTGLLALFTLVKIVLF